MAESRALQMFSDLVAIDSVSLKERECADYIKARLLELGVEFEEDDAGSTCGGNAGNIYGILRGNRESKENNATLFMAHMDTVQPGIGKSMEIKEDGTIVGNGTTVLGADDISGIVSILEALYQIKEQGKSHYDIELLFTIGEEVYGKGSKAFDFTKVKANKAYAFDLSGPVGTASLQEPTLISYKARIIGKPAHAGRPEEGISAIAVAADIIHNIEKGRISSETTHNIGKIHGGTIINCVPEHVEFEGEIRSYDDAEADQFLERLKAVIKEHAAKYHAISAITSEKQIKAYKVREDEEVVKGFLAACDKIGTKGTLTRAFGGSDNNISMQRGIRGIVVASGMQLEHTANEYSSVSELMKSIQIAFELMTRE